MVFYSVQKKHVLYFSLGTKQASGILWVLYCGTITLSLNSFLVVNLGSQFTLGEVMISAKVSPITLLSIMTRI